MATTELPTYAPHELPRSLAAAETSAADVLRTLLTPLASLRLTVTLLSLSLFLVLAGTLAQIDRDVWDVVHNYFRTWWSAIELRIFFPRAWNISDRWFWFPGGKTLGVGLALNLIAAHGLRFKVAARGRRLFLGVLVLLAGVGATYAVIASGSNIAVESQLSPTFVNGLWHAFRSAIGAVALAICYFLALSWKQSRHSAAAWVWWLGAVVAGLIALLAAYLFLNPDVRLDASGLRILWQLAKASIAASILALGCWAVFAKRGGVVLLHSGIALLMFGELYTAQYVVESQMQITEGETAIFAEDMRHVELAVTDLSDPAVDRTTLVPESVLENAVKMGQPIEHPELPFAIHVDRFMKNAVTRLLQADEEPVATAGLGQLRIADERRSSKGVDAEQTFDAAAGTFRLAADGGSNDGVYLLSPALNGEIVAHGGKSYEVALRFKRIPKRYTVTLLDFKHDLYEGTTKAKNFESVVRLQDKQQNIDVTVPIYMNNPLRYAGDTLYQHSFDPRTERTTTLQVMSNAGWMIPWVSCMIVWFGMGFHFLLTFARFVGRQVEESKRLARAPREATVGTELAARGPRWSRKEYWIPAVLVVALAGYAMRHAAPPREAATEMKLYEFSQLPVVYGGRTQPLDSLARNTLRMISERATYADSRYDDRQPAIRWLLDVASRADAFRKHRVLRIVNLEVLQALGLEQRPGKWQYSINELLANAEEFERQVRLAAEVPEEKRNLTQAKFLELDRKVKQVLVLIDVFSPPAIDGQTQQEFIASFQAADARIANLNQFAPRPIPPATPGGEWQTLMEAQRNEILDSITKKDARKPDEASVAWRNLLAAYRADDAQKFNSATAELKEIVDQRAAAERQFEREHETGRKPSERLVPSRIAFESYFNHFDPFYVAMILYIIAFVLAASAWLGWFEGFNRAANWLLWFTFGLHTFGLICRIYISGRPPVTNLYSTAVFIGWAGVLFALIFEVIYKMGIGNLLAALLGFPTMIIAYQLSFDNNADTVEVLVPVLDTNFWLTIHVLCINLGYATSLLAGGIGLISLLLGELGGKLDPGQRRQLTRMTYGTVCFAIFFSFIGTVLGGLWADDSWGRFWGWDPKENGALMIVIWNAIVLHARFGKMVGDRGLAALVVLGNIVTAWSWFGVNQMGVGLHAYGATEGRGMIVAAFMMSQLVVVAAAYFIPLATRSFRNDSWPPAASAP